MSVCDRRLGGRRARLHGDRQPGPALHGRGALQRVRASACPIVMTVANRAIGAPINIWNDHSDAMSQRDSGWIQLFAETNQEARRPAHPGVPARRGAVAAGDGLHGRLHPHPRVRARSTCPTQEQVDAFLPPFEPRQVLDPDDPVTIGAMVGPEAFTEVKYLAHAKQMQALDADPARSPATSRARSDATRRARARLPDRGRRDRRRRARLGARHDRGRRRRAARRRAMRVGARRHQVLPAVAAGRGARGARARQPRRRRSRRRSRSASAASSALDVRIALQGLPAHVYDVIAGLGGRPITKASLHGLLDEAMADSARPDDVPRPRPRAASSASCARSRATSCRDRTRRTCCATIGIVAARAGLMAASRCSSTKSGSFVVGNRLLEPDQRSVQADAQRSNTLTSGHRACQGCGEALGARYALDAAMRATRRPLIAANATGCLEVFSTPVPGELVAAAVDPLAVRQRAGGRHRHRRRAEGQGPRRRARRSARAATAARSTSASAACRACSSAATTCCSSATTTRAT